MGGLAGGSGPDFSSILNIGTQAEAVGKTLSKASQAGGTPFQKSLLKSYQKTANANFANFGKEFAASGGGVGISKAQDYTDLTDEQTQALGADFINGDMQLGLNYLGLAGSSYATAAGISVGQQQQTMQAAGSAARLIGSIMAAF